MGRDCRPLCKVAGFPRRNLSGIFSSCCGLIQWLDPRATLTCSLATSCPAVRRVRAPIPPGLSTPLGSVEKHFQERSAELQIPPRHAGTGRLRDDKGEGNASMEEGSLDRRRIRWSSGPTKIGVRMALGADRKSVVSMILCGAFRQVGVGWRWGSRRQWDPAMLLTATVLLALAALAAALIPARRAASLDPMQALRTE
jgi:hypothetical protein